MNQIEKLATAKAVKDKDLKMIIPEIASGIHLVDCRVRLRGALTKSDPYKQRVAAAADPWKLLALAMSKLNNTSIDALVREARDLENIGEEDLKLKAKQAIEAIVEDTEREIEGRITANIQWSLES